MGQTDHSRELLQRLDKIARLIAVSIIADRKQRDQIRILWRAGLQPKEIADLLGTTRNTVSVELSAMRRAGRTRISAGQEARREEE
jgi:DNA-binding CsgD family transcriptional regulator